MFSCGFRTWASGIQMDELAIIIILEGGNGARSTPGRCTEHPRKVHGLFHLGLVLKLYDALVHKFPELYTALVPKMCPEPNSSKLGNCLSQTVT